MKKSKRVKIAGIGKHLPERRVMSAELESRLQLEAGWIARKTAGVERRHAEEGVTQSEMGAHAARAALLDAGMKVSDIDLILCASAAPEQCIPCTAVFVQRALGPD